MSGIVFGAVAPHGWPTIHQLSDDAMGALQTRRALEEMGRRCAASRPDTIVLATPHGVRVEGAIGIAATARGAGTLHLGERSVELNLPFDPAFAKSVAGSARDAGLPVAMTGFGGNNLAESVMPLDWGSIVPLWFLGHGRHLPGYGNVLADDPPEDSGPPVVVVSPSRSLPRGSNVEFGAAVAAAAARDAKRVAFIASCDWAHAHPGGRAEFSEAAAEVDATVVRAIEQNALESLISLDEELVESSAIDGLWQLLMLAGALRDGAATPEVLSYEAPSAYATGMIVAAFPVNEP